jgi:DtxR family Mn-dependent transcriptional regulator
MSPLLNLAIAAALAAVLWVLLRPQRGWLWVWMRARRLTQRVLVEDALKHIYDCDYTGTQATVQSLAGALAIGTDQATRLCQRLESLGLLTSSEPGLTLAPEGRSYALRIIRIHRLWEQYLADRTGLEQADWHAEADRKEHVMTSDEADALAAAMGNPCFDPHGDPIPSADGRVPQHRGQPLNTVPVGERVRVVHVEDEPEAIYAQLIAARFNPGTILRVVQHTPDRIRVAAEDEEHILAPVVAANLSVERLPGDGPDVPRKRRLSSLEVGQEATVIDIATACRGQQRRRLLDLGVVPGTTIRAELRSPAGDPTAYRIRGAVVALRKVQAEMIHIRS